VKRRIALVTPLVLLLSVAAAAQPEVGLDHLVLGISDLSVGIDILEKRAGVKPVLGGIHPDRGTHNALLSLGEDTYLEIVAPNPQAEHLDPMVAGLTSMKTLTPMRWIVRTDDAERTVEKLRTAGYSVMDPRPGSRTLPDGRALTWRLFALNEPPSPSAPFFIEWGKDGPHPSTTSPGGCRIVRLALEDPSPDVLRKLLTVLGLEIAVSQSEKPALRFALTCPGGTLEFP
jgi:glyoxalase-like protein